MTALVVDLGALDGAHGAFVVGAARDLNIQAPIVVRMEGTNVELGRKILAESGFNFTVADGMRDAAEKVVELAARQ